MHERRQAEEQLRQSQKIEAIGRLAGGIAHDFNNLLTVVASYSEIAIDSLDETDPVRGYVFEIRRAAERAASLTQQLLAFSRKQMLLPTVVNLNNVVAGVEPMLRRLIGEDVNLVTYLAENLPPVLVDPGQMEQVIMNLAVNARDAMPNGGSLVIETSVADVSPNSGVEKPAVMTPARYLLLAVTDSGHGMDAETQARIFEPFFTTKEPGRGTGLGLATVYGIIKQSGGWIWVYSEPGQGTTFKMYLPPSNGAVVESPQPQSVAGRGDDKVSGTILVVEDQPDVRNLAAKLLRREGYTVLEASSGDEALRLADEHDGPIDLLLSDVVMPGLSGREVAERLTRRRPGLRTLFMSGYTDNVIADRGVLGPDMAFLPKPFTSITLLAGVRDALTR
jgi:nitrogen-specific signal transduction histidine kinase